MEGFPWDAQEVDGRKGGLRCSAIVHDDDLGTLVEFVYPDGRRAYGVGLGRMAKDTARDTAKDTGKPPKRGSSRRRWGWRRSR